MAFKGKNSSEDSSDEQTGVDVKRREELNREMTVVDQPERVSDDTLRQVVTFDDAMELSAGLYGEVQSFAEEIGNGFTIIKSDDKSRLIGKSFLAIQWRFHYGEEYDQEFVSVVLVTKENERLVMTDGSSGVFQQLRDLTDRKGIQGGFLAKYGLRDSKYDTCKNCGKPRGKRDKTCDSCGDTSDSRATGTTYYIDGAA